MNDNTQEEARLLLQHVRDFVSERGTKRGAMVYACRKVYGAVVESRKAIERGRKTLRKYKARLNMGMKPTF